MVHPTRLDDVRLIWPLRAANTVGGWIARLGVAPSLDPERFEALACKNTGLDDFGDAEYREPLERLCGELARSDQLTTAGRLSARDQLVRSLSNRLLLVEARKRDPGLTTEPMNAPLVVIGLPRSGTTFLHRVLCDAPGALAPVTWMLQRPVPPMNRPDNRRALSHRLIGGIRRMAPGLDAKHHLDPEQPEECMVLLDASLASLTLGFLLPVYDYTEWLYSRDGVADYAVWRDSLVFFQRLAPDQRLTLKAPTHTAFLRAIWHHVPDAMVVQPHRDPIKTVGSLCSLFHTLHGLALGRVDRQRLGACMLEMCGRMADRCIDDRDSHPEKRVVDVAYRALVANPVGAVADLYRAHGLPVTGALESALTDAVAARPQHRFGRHDYALEDFGLDPAKVRARLARYLERFGHLVD